jgi:hypothetical protein
MRSLLCLLSLIALPAPGPALAAGLNDTGITSCSDGKNLVACTAANLGDSAAYPSQDARYGRDAAQAAGKLPAKIGGGAAGFDFTPLDASGNAIALTGNPPVPAATPACTRDNVTGLVWEVKTAANMNAPFTWANAAAYASSTNSSGLCGSHSGWRVPTRRELLSIVHRGTSYPAIDTYYFPNTASYYYWSSDVSATVPTYAWVVIFGDGLTYAHYQSHYGHVRLVRSGQ